MNLMERVEATQRTIDKFIDQPFAWGSADCGYLAGTHLDHCGIANPLASVATYTTELGAKRALTKLGVADMADLVDRQGFERIAPASALPGDIVGFPGGEDEDHEWLALGIAIGQSAIIGFANDRCMRGPIDVCTVAWRVG